MYCASINYKTHTRQKTRCFLFINSKEKLVHDPLHIQVFLVRMTAGYPAHKLIRQTTTQTKLHVYSLLSLLM
jgi:hypothetical protein